MDAETDTKELFLDCIKTRCATLGCNATLPGTWEYYRIHGNYCVGCSVKTTKKIHGRTKSQLGSRVGRFKCQECGDTFYIRRSNQLYCSYHCGNRAKYYREHGHYPRKRN